jgi:hypothetical protein
MVNRLAVAAALQFVAPGLTVGYRSIRRHRAKSLVSGIFLYWLYYVARIQALALIVSGRARQYRK